MLLECKLTFEAAHRNTSAQATERTRRLHGHSYEVTVAVQGTIDPAIGWIMDFATVKDRANEVIDRLDHRILNDIPGMLTTARDDVERWTTEALRPTLPELHHCRIVVRGNHQWTPSVRRVTPNEVLAFGFDAAHFLPTLPESHKCRRVHGHSFRVEVTAADASRLSGPLFDIYERLDHRLLNDVAGLENPTSEILADWIKTELMRRNSQFTEIMVAETCTSCCRLRHA